MRTRVLEVCPMAGGQRLPARYDANKLSWPGCLLVVDFSLDDCGLAKLHSDEPSFTIVRSNVADLSLNLKSLLVAGNG